ncbi:putative serine protein kinase Sky1 [Histoplasma ohiense]|nr:putative serine protein kinase Sky1 [Histoplasma ohiense (nom. inval.)]
MECGMCCGYLRIQSTKHILAITGSRSMRFSQESICLIAVQVQRDLMSLNIICPK